MSPELKSKRSILVLTSLLFSCIPFFAKSQCDVTITPQSSTTFCEGGSVTLVAYANGDSIELDQSQTLYNGGTSARNLPGYSYWQSFEAGITGTLVQIDAGFFTLIDGTGYWTVWEGSGTGGTMLDSQEVNIYCDGGNCLLSFTENIPVTAGEMYTFQIRGGTGMPDPYGLQIGAGNPYTSGDMGFVDPSGTYITDFDWVFNTYVQTGDISYEWSNGSTDSSINVTIAGDYSVIATSTSGCTSTAEVEVTVNPLPEVNLEAEDDSVCVSDAPVELTGSPAGGIFSGVNVNENLFSPAWPGEFMVYYTYTDANGCSNTDSTKIVAFVCTGVDALNKQNSVSLFASLSEGQITIKADKGLIGSDFSFYNLIGEQILTVRLQDEITVVNVGNATGMYLYMLRNNNQIISSGKISVVK